MDIFVWFRCSSKFYVHRNITTLPDYQPEPHLDAWWLWIWCTSSRTVGHVLIVTHCFGSRYGYGKIYLFLHWYIKTSISKQFTVLFSNLSAIQIFNGFIFTQCCATIHVYLYRWDGWQLCIMPYFLFIDRVSTLMCGFLVEWRSVIWAKEHFQCVHQWLCYVWT